VGRAETIETRVLRLPPRAVDAAVAAALGVAVLATEATATHPSIVTASLGLVVSASVTLRRRVPVVAVVAADAAASNLFVVPIAIALNYYALGRRGEARGRNWVDALLLAFPVAGIALSPSTPNAGNPLVVDVLSIWAFFVAIPFAAGRTVGSRTALNAELRANAERLEAEQRERARQAVAEERTRIARELHDVVAHSVSVMVIQTAAARRVATRDRAQAAEALRSVETCGRDALIDLRRMVGVLHRDDLELLGGAPPGLSQLAKLVERACASGLPTALSIDGDPRPLSPALDLVSFRVVQEALTNAIKHAGPAKATVRLTFAAGSLELEITDTGRGSLATHSPGGSPGHGLVGMHERLTLYGGQLHTTRRRGGGFQVLARIPLDEMALA
jgi:signal transduction histidine kinase